MDDESGIFATIPEANVSLMSVREWQWTTFAAAALQAFIQRPESCPLDGNANELPYRNLAIDAHMVADAMMAEIERREKGGE